MRRHIITTGTLALGVLALLLSGTAAAPAANAADPGPPTIVVDAPAPLHEGDLMTVHATGFEPGATYGAGECLLTWVDDENGARWEVGDCAPGSWGNQVDASGDGSFTAELLVTQALQQGPMPTITVSPNGYLTEGQIVTVTGVDFPSTSNVVDCQNPGGDQVCGVAVYRGSDMSDWVAFAPDVLTGQFASDWYPPRYVIGQTVTQQLESIILTGQLDPNGSRWADNADQVTAPINPDTGTFSTQYRVHRWLGFSNVGYAIEGGPTEPVWGQTWPPPPGVVAFDWTFDCAAMPAHQEGREIQDPECSVVVMEPQGSGNWGMHSVTFRNQWLTVTADGNARLLKGSKQVQISGLTTCSDPTTIHLEGTLSQQPRKGPAVTAIVRADVSCAGKSGWTVTTYTAAGKFLAGSATLTLDATSPGFTPVNGQNTTIRLVTIR